MTYLRILRLIDAVVSWLMRRCDTTSRAWAELAAWHGRISFRQIDYAKRVQKASGWERAEVHSDVRPWTFTVTPSHPAFIATVGANTTTYTGTYR